MTGYCQPNPTCKVDLAVPEAEGVGGKHAAHFFTLRICFTFIDGKPLASTRICYGYLILIFL
jgi:hypothetical protein